MSYNPAIPQANDNPTVSQGQFLNNFSLMNTFFDVNHVAYTAGGNNGLHDKITYPTPISDPNLAAPQSSVYPKTFFDPITLAQSVELFQQNGNQFFNTAQLTNSAVCNLVITLITAGTPCKVTTATNHGLQTNDQVTLSGINGVTTLNNTTKTITVSNSTQFTLNGTTPADLTSYLTPAGFPFNGYIYTPALNTPTLKRFGFVSPWGLIFNMGLAPSTGASGDQYYSIPYPVGFNIFGIYLTTFGTDSLSSPYVITYTDRKKFTYKGYSQTYFLAIGK